MPRLPLRGGDAQRQLSQRAALRSIQLRRANRLTTTCLNGGQAQTALNYDARNRCVQRMATAGGVMTTTYFVWDGWNLLLEDTGSGTTSVSVRASATL